MSKLKTDIKKISLGLIICLSLLTIILQTSIVSASKITRTFYPPYYKSFYSAENPNYGIPFPINYAECWNSDSDIYGADIHVGENVILRSVSLGVAKEFTESTSRTINFIANFRIDGYLSPSFSGGFVRLRIGITLQRWVNSYWSFVKFWDMVEYYLEPGESLVLQGDSIHYAGPNYWLSSGTYRLNYNLYAESLGGFFCESSNELYEPGKIYFDSIGYQYDAGGGGGGCPILSVFNGQEYIEEGLLDIHNPDGIDEIYEHMLITQPAITDNHYNLRLTEHPKTISHIDRVELWGKLSNGRMIKLPLISAIHSEEGQVRFLLWFSDDKKIDEVGADYNNGVSQSIDLQFLKPQGLQFIQFQFVIEGNNQMVK